MWTFIALDPDSKLIPSYRVGKRDMKNTSAFINDLSKRLNNRIQLSSDALKSYINAIEDSFGADIDYGQLVKIYESDPIGPGRYSPPHVIDSKKTIITGNPDQTYISTSLVERQNLTIRMGMRRFTRLTNAFSKKIENLRAAVSLHFAYYNFARIHSTIKVTPAMEAGIENSIWTISELVEMADSN